MSGASRVTAVIVHFRTESLLDECLSALRDLDEVPLEVVVVDNGSISDEAFWRERFGWARWVFARENRGFAAGVNLGAARADSEYLFILNPDARPMPGCLSELARILDENPRVAAAGPQLVSPVGKPQPSAGRAPSMARLLGGKLVRAIGRHERRSAAREIVDVDWLSATALLCRRRAWNEVGGMDEGFFMYYEDCDLAARLRACGWQLWLVPNARAVHVGGASFAGDSQSQIRAFRRSEERYFRKHRATLELVAIKALRPIYDALDLRPGLYGEPRVQRRR